MADDPIVTDAGWTCTITAGSTAVSLTGILGTASGAERGDDISTPAGRLTIAAVGAGLTLLHPAPAAFAGTFQFAWLRGAHRSLEALSTIKSNDVYARLSLMADEGRSIPVIAWQNAPPSTPAHGDRYLVATGSGAWAGQNGRFAEYNTSGTAGWIFVSPKAGWAATINGSLVRLQFTGTAWGATSPIAGTTTVVGRLARFTDTAGGMGQSAMSEDGSGNVTIPGTLSARGQDTDARYARRAAENAFTGNQSVNGIFTVSPTTGAAILEIAAVQAGATAFLSLRGAGRAFLVSGFDIYQQADGVATLYNRDAAADFTIFARGGEAFRIGASRAVSIQGSFTAQDRIRGPSFRSTVTAAVAWTYDVTETPISIADGATVYLPTGSGLITVSNHAVGEVATLMVGVGQVNLMGQIGTKFEASATPASGKIGIYFDSSPFLYGFKNNTGGTVTLGIAAIKTRNTV